MGVSIWLSYRAEGAPDQTWQAYDANITHNVARMWREAGVYEVIYDGEGRKAKDVTSTLRAGVADMLSRPSHFKQFNPVNGWGDYAGALKFLDRLTRACEEHPEAIIGVSA